MEFFKTFEHYSDELYTAIDKYKVYEKIIMALFKEIIESNNIEEIKKTVDMLPKVYISSAQFLFKRIYELENNLVEADVKNVDFDAIREKINVALVDYIPTYLEFQKLNKVKKHS